MLFLITGGEGFIGAHLRRLIEDQGHEAVSVDDYRSQPLSPTYQSNIEKPVEHLKAFDLEGIDTVVHLASYKNVPESFKKTRECVVNVHATLNLLDACSAAKVDRVLLGSTCEVFGRSADPVQSAATTLAPRSPYAMSKVASESIADIYRAGGRLEVCKARIFNTYGPTERPDAVVPAMCKQAIETGSLTIEGDGRQRRDFTYVTDMVARLYALALAEEVPEAANLGSGTTTSITEVATMIADYAKQSIGIDVEVVFAERRHQEIDSFCSTTSDWSALVNANKASAIPMPAGIAKTFDWWAERLTPLVHKEATLS